MSRYAMSNAVMDIQRPVATPPTNPVPLPPVPESNQTPPQSPQLPPTAKKPGRRKGPIIAIIVIVVVVLGLIAGAVFFYMQSQNQAEEPATQTPTETPVVDDGHVDPEDIDAATQKIDSDLTNLNDSADFGADDLTDSTIGL